MVTDSRFLTPPREEEEVYPYRRVWRSIVIESGILLAITAALFILVEVFGFQIPANLHLPVGVVIAFAPIVLWLSFFWLLERFVPQPRRGLIAVLIVSALAANAVGIPLINDFLQVDRWLPLSSAIDRIFGYMFTVGIVQETLKYLVVRYIAWPDLFRIRLDGVAYCVASAVGYVTVLNLYFVFDSSPSPHIVALRVFGTIAIHFATSVVVGYGLGEVCFGRPSLFLLPVTVAVAAFITGVAIPVRSGLVNAPFSLGNSAPRLILGLGFSVVLLVALLVIMSFLFNISERQEREAAAGREV